MAFPLPALPSQDLNHATEQAGELLGVQSAYWDIWGREHRPDPAIQRAILAAHSIPTDSAAALDDAIRRRVHTSHLAILPPSTVTTPADPFVSLCLPQPSEPAAWQLILEDGSPLTG
ncbi:MAG: hypothetical protein ACK59B_15005, partial [Alphaproteobacteria bacterium]